MAAPQLPLLPGMVRLGSQSSLTGLEQSGTPELKPMAAPRLPLLPGMRRGSQISLTGLVRSGSNPLLNNHPESSLAGAGLVRSGSPTLMGTMRRRSGSQSSTVSVGKQKKQQATAEVNICNGAAECISTADMPQRIFSLASDMSESKASIVGLLDHYGLLDESVLSGFGTYPRDRKHRKDGREVETADTGICSSPPRKPLTDAEINSECAISSRVRPSTPPRIPLTDAESWSRIRPATLTPRKQLETEYMTTNKLKGDCASRLEEMLRDSNETLHTPPSSWSRFR
jgi:hypothetical protein